jgi:hypothetical protein
LFVHRSRYVATILGPRTLVGKRSTKLSRFAAEPDRRDWWGRWVWWNCALQHPLAPSRDVAQRELRRPGPLHRRAPPGQGWPVRTDGLAQFVRGRDGLGERPIVVFHVPFVPGEIASFVRSPRCATSQRPCRRCAPPEIRVSDCRSGYPARRSATPANACTAEIGCGERPAPR